MPSAGDFSDRRVRKNARGEYAPIQSGAFVPVLSYRKNNIKGEDHEKAEIYPRTVRMSCGAHAGALPSAFASCLGGGGKMHQRRRTDSPLWKKRATRMSPRRQKTTPVGLTVNVMK